MVEPLALTIKLVKGVAESMEEVSTNYEDCARLRRQAEKTLALVKQIEAKSLDRQHVYEAICFVNEALKGAQAAIDDCCNTSCLCALLLHKTHSLALHRAEKDLNHALTQVPIAALGMISGVQDDLTNLVSTKSHEKLEERAVRAHQTNTLKKEIEEVCTQMNQGFEKAFKQTHEVIKEASAQTHQEIGEGSAQTHQEIGEASACTSRVIKEESARTNQEIENIKNQIGQMQKLGLQTEQTGALMVTTIIVENISENSTKVKVNQDGSTLLAKLTQKTLRFFENFDESAMSNSQVLGALCKVNEALVKVKHSIDDCCNTDVSHAAIVHEEYSSKLKEVAIMLWNALVEMSPLLDGMSHIIQSTLSSLCNEIHDSKFDGSVDVEEDDVLLEQRGDFVEAPQSTQNYDGPFPLHFAVSNDWIDSIKELISNGVNVNILDEDGHTPLWIASRDNHVDIVKELIDSGADVNLQYTDGASPLHIASYNGHIDVVKELIANDGDVNLQTNLGASPLYIASEMGCIEIVKELLARGGDVNLQTNDGRSPLHIASQEGHIEVVKELIAQGGDVNLQQNNGASPLHIASFDGHIEVVKELIESYAKIDIRAKNRWTHLHVASSCGRIDVVQILLEHGASKSIRNNRLRKPYHVVCTNESCGPYEESTIGELKSLLRR